MEDNNRDQRDPDCQHDIETGLSGGAGGDAKAEARDDAEPSAGAELGAEGESGAEAEAEAEARILAQVEARVEAQAAGVDDAAPEAAPDAAPDAAPGAVEQAVGPAQAAGPRVSDMVKKELVEYLQALVIAVVLAAFIITFIAQSFLVQGYSMEPTLHDRERLLVNKIVYRIRRPARGEIVVFKYPSGPRRKFIKRIIGVAGDTVEVRGGQVYLNGQPLEEGYIAERPRSDYGPAMVPESRVFVLGDNRNNSDDSRYSDVGFVPLNYVVGKAFVIFWPPARIGIVRVPEVFEGLAAGQ